MGRVRDKVKKPFVWAIKQCGESKEKVIKGWRYRKKRHVTRRQAQDRECHNSLMLQDGVSARAYDHIHQVVFYPLPAVW